MNGYYLIGSDDRIHELPADKNVMIGRAPINAIVLDDRLVSRCHAGIAPSPKGPVLTDRDSANGVQVNGLATKDTLLHHGDAIRIGKYILHVFCGSRADAEKWLARRKSDTRTDQTMTDLNVNPARSAGMIGDLSAFSIVSLMQMMVDQKRHGAVTLTQRGELLGKIFFAGGAVIHAETTTALKGRDAFLELAGVQHGAFNFQTDVKPPALSMIDTSEELLVEARRRFEEKRAEAIRV